MTKRACEFVQPLTFRALSGSHVIVDDYAPDNPDPIAHITFSQTVDLLIVAPATANMIAKFANGVADDFLSSTYLACTAPVLIAPAMNTTMLEHPATQRNQTCEADFYVGEWQVLHANAALAKPLLQAAAANCPNDFIERAAAGAELERLP